jgi:hypothetical protein
MKCVQSKRSKKIKRVSDEKAWELVNSGVWTYVGKSEWKRLVRDVQK